VEGAGVSPSEHPAYPAQLCACFFFCLLSFLYLLSPSVRFLEQAHAGHEIPLKRLKSNWNYTEFQSDRENKFWWSWNRSLNCFCWKALTPSWAHELTESRRKTWHAHLHFVSAFALSHSLCSHFAITLGSGNERIGDNIFMTRGLNYS
jgi:hypothetical protein